MVPTRGYGMMAACKQKAQTIAIQARDLASLANDKVFSKFYKAESVRTAAIRSAMAIYCLADGTCSGSDAGIIALAIANTVTALTYNASNEQHSSILPKQFNLLADGIATISSFDASALPITGSNLEMIIRSIVGKMSIAATTITCLPTSKAEMEEYLDMVRAYLKK